MDDEIDQWLDPAFWKALHLRERMWRRPEKRIPPIRNRVFTEELKELAASIKQHGSRRPDEALRFEDFGPPLTGLAGYLARLYARKDAALPELIPLEWKRRFAALACAVLLFSREEGVFRLLLSAGLSDLQRQNLWVSARDPFFTRDAVQSFIVDSSLKENPFFAKRFTKEFLADLGGIVSIPHEDRSAPALMIFFFSGKPPALPVEELRSVLCWIHPLLVRHIEKDKRTHLRRNIYRAAAREVRAFVNLSEGAQLVQLSFVSPLDGEICNRFLKELRRVLKHQRQVLVLRLRHDSLKILLTPDLPVQSLLQTVSDIAAGFNIEVRSFQMPVSPDVVSSAVL
jgi:hypothetical protein